MLLDEFKEYFKYIKSLKFMDLPDYDFLKRLFRELYSRQPSTQFLFDWENPSINSSATSISLATNFGTLPNSATNNNVNNTIPVNTSGKELDQPSNDQLPTRDLDDPANDQSPM